MEMFLSEGCPLDPSPAPLTAALVLKGFPCGLFKEIGDEAQTEVAFVLGIVSSEGERFLPCFCCEESQVGSVPDADAVQMS